MKRLIMALILGAFTMVIFAGCGGSAKNIDLVQTGDEIIQSAGFSDMTDSKHLLNDYYNISEESYTDVYLKRDASGASPDELVIFKAASQDKIDEIENACSERKTELSDRFSDYLPLEMPKINSSIIYTENNYIMFVVCEDSAKAKEIFKNALNG